MPTTHVLVVSPVENAPWGSFVTVAERREGRENLYRLTPEPLSAVGDWVAFYERFWSTNLRSGCS